MRAKPVGAFQEIKRGATVLRTLNGIAMSVVWDVIEMVLFELHHSTLNGGSR